MSNRRKLVQGVGVNDADYRTQIVEKVDGKRRRIWTCPYYRKWNDMLARAYSQRFHDKRSSYLFTTVCDEWHTFSNFKQWMESQDWEGKELDKDLINPDADEYSPDNCAFVDGVVNMFGTDRESSRGNLPIGVSVVISQKKPYQASCSNTFTGRREHLGVYATPEEAHQAWKQRKHALALELIDGGLVGDERVEDALRARYR